MKQQRRRWRPRHGWIWVPGDFPDVVTVVPADRLPTVAAVADLLEREMPRPGDAWHPRLVAERLAERIVKL